MKNTVKAIILSVAIIFSVITILFSVFLSSAIAQDQTYKSQEVKYYVGEFEEKVAIFKTSEKNPIEILDVRLDSLPERDIEKIKSKILFRRYLIEM